MKKLVFLIVLAAIGLYYYNGVDSNPSVIEQPVYLESRVYFSVPNSSRELEFVFMGEMVSQSDCTERSGNYPSKLLEKCPECIIKSSECKSDIHSQYQSLFVDEAMSTTYLSLTKGNRFERNARLVVWGLSDKEAKLVCRDMKTKILANYEGTARCI
ncbi:hypothetical protein [Psychrobium sp. 1_MG-2023]|uniref:hypothetical protein n=1 Tax=Psychrobium sp. 1_MG-2023 TaxID=3062624 RepID=UPI000C33E0B5|nr:hypothetical protein [Psychrobium sp. 1_MG-2023]MDP2561508.1 hypothetical protein [Psychrobium sp. 1_MG-2023]PKF57773.1 hypothetical protein CW748_06145 [Alteromonadales bacterium alter-6D02]